MADLTTNRILIDVDFQTDKLHCAHKIFEHTVTQNKERVAVRDHDNTLTFDALNKKANKIAHYLIDQGVKNNDCVLLYFNRGIDVIAALLGILKSGAAYIPVIPKFPEQRILQIIKDAKTSIALTEKALEHSAGIKDCKVVVTNNPAPVFEKYPDTNPEIKNSIEQLAYVIYTSGTTGAPKGAMIQHKALCSFFLSQQKIYFDEDTNLYNAAFSAPLVFDFNVQQWTQLLAGHTLVAVPEECRYDGKLFIEYAKKYNLQSIGFTPSEMNMHIEAGMFEQLPGLTHLTIGGEAVNQKLWDNVSKQKHIKAFNTYGPAECTVYVTTAQFKEEDKLSIGKATPNADLFIVDTKLEKVKNGEPGELIIGGLCVGKGYLNNKELTEKSYIKTPWGGDKIFYKSGDKVRLLENGNYEYLGRIDRQVKIRGNRIELAEIEHVLKLIPGIENAICTVNEDDPDNKFLVGYIKGETKTTSPKIKEILSQKLPGYMVPGVYVFVDKFKLTPNGKIDTKALPSPTEKDTLRNIVKPQTQTQTILVEIWKTVLKTAQISITDNFFEIGGHSLRATQVVSHINKELNKQLKISDVFTQPVLSDLAQYTDSLPEKKNENKFKCHGEIEKAPLAYSQIRPWSVFQIKGANSLYNILIEIKINGQLDTGLLNKSLQILAKQHPAIRTRFGQENGEAFQIIEKQVDINIKTTDLSGQENIAGKKNQIVEELANYHFNLTSSPLFRFEVIKSAANTYSLFVCMHHTITDGWSMGIFIKDLSRIYNKLYHQKEPENTDTSFSYSDFALYQQNYFKSNSYQENLNFWKNELSGIPELLNLPYDRFRPAEQSFDGNTIVFSLNETLSSQVLGFSGQSNISPYMTCLAAYFILLKKLSRSDDIVVGSVIANRNHKELENVFGFFSNTILIRALFDNDFTSNDFIEYIRDKNLKGFENQDMPMDKLIDELKPNRNLSYNPMFQVVFNYQNMVLGNLDLPGATVGISQIHNHTAKVDLTLNLREENGVISGEIEYAKDLFSEQSIYNYIGYYKNILETISSKKEVKISEISLLGKAAGEKYKNPFTYTPVTTWFNKTAENFGEKVAVRSPGEKFTYSEINKLSNKCANYLLKNHTEKIIGISLERSPWDIAVILGILKAGKAYLPIDLKYPDDRKKIIIEDSGLQTLICSQKTNTPIEQITLTELKNNLGGYNAENPNIIPEEKTPAYIIYTSGTTGKPKGVVIGHETLSYFTQASCRHYAISEKDTVLQFASISFDAAVEEIFPSLCSGATLFVRDENMISTNKHFLERCNEYGITILDLPTAYWHNLVSELDSLDISTLKNIRTIILGGEAVKHQAVKKWFSHFNETPALINTYGPTEATVVATKHTIRKSDLAAQIPIGTPIANVCSLVVNSHNQPVPVGIPGELCLGGDCLALGYLKNEKLTNEKFIPINGQRFYKTGDLVRLKTNGDLDFMGRIDNQVKIRGFRVELTEIENSIRQSDKIKDCVVCAKNIEENHLDIVAYIVKNKDFETDELIRRLEKILPAFMVPAYFVFIDEIPLNINKKVDFKSLPLPSGNDRKTNQGQYKKPETEIQKTISGIWCELLKLEKISITDNFFRLGGHSLLATQVISRIEKSTGKQIALQKIFENPTIESLGDYINSDNISSGAETINIQRINRKNPIPLSSSQKRMWFIEQLEGANASYNIPLDFKISGKFDVGILKKSLAIIAQRHEILRTAFINQTGNPAQLISENPVIDFSHLDFSEKSQSEAEKSYLDISDNNAQFLFDLTRNPLWRSVLIKMPEKEEYRLLFNFHHIISDGWSVGIFVKELSEIYNSVITNKKIPLREQNIQYADFAGWQQKSLNSDTIKKQVAYWCNKLNNAPEIIQLPTDFTRKKEQTFNGGETRFALDKTIALKLKELANNNNISLYMLLFSAYVILLHKHSNDTDIIVGTPIANRKTGLTDNLIGIFINNLAIRSKVNGEQNIERFIEQVKQDLFEAYKNQEAPFENILEKLQLKRNLSISPLFQVMFNLLNAHNEQLNFDGTQVGYLDIPRKIAKYDLSLIISERAGVLHGIFEYNSDLFKPSTIERMSNHYQQILSQMLTSLKGKISEISILNHNEKTLLLKQVNDTNQAFPEEKCYHQLFEASAQEHAEKVAVIFQEETLTYRELNNKANQLAHYLCKKGIGPGDFVGLFVERSTEMLVALIAIMKTGAAYIPLDPIYPKDRIKLIIDDANPKAIIAHEKLMANLPGTNAALININDQTIAQQKQENVNIETASWSVVYQIYTSGSTGKPKGVQIRHSSLNNFLLSMAIKPGCAPTDTLLAVTTISFDIAGLELFMPLLTGAKIVIAKQEEAMNAQFLMALIEKHRPTILQATPVTFKMLLMAKWQGSPDLKILCGGEAFPSDLAQTLIAKNKEVWNMYGPTETTIWSTIKKVEKNTHSKAYETIGFPIANTQVYVVDNHMNPQPIGVSGELLIGGKGIAKGYYNRPELNNERFVKSPFIEGEILYKTGDRVKFLENGNLEYLERMDNQVKIRGFRIELGEIENALKSLPQIRDAVVVVKEDSTKNKILSAYLIPTKGKINQNQIVKEIKQKIPDYMLPGFYTELDKFPMTPNGKIDRKALPDPQSTVSSEIIAPRSKNEKIILQIWKEILGKTEISIDDDFFALGGHSLLAVTLMVKIEEETGARLPLATLFSHTTIRELAQYIETDNISWESLVPIKPGGGKQPVYLVHGAGLNVLLYNSLVNHLDKEQPIFGLQAKGLNGKEKPLETIEEIAAHYNNEIITHNPNGPYALAGFSLGGLIAFEMARQLTEAGKKVVFLGMLDTVAYSSLKKYSKFGKLAYRAWFTFNQIIYNTLLFLKEPLIEKKQFLQNKQKSLKRKINTFIYRQKVKIAQTKTSQGDKEELPEYLYNVHEANNIAGDNYIIPPSDLKVELFRAKHQTFYIEEPSTYNWKKYAKKGVNIYDVPGEHSSIFAPPHDKEFAKILQNCLNKSFETGV